MHCDCSSGRKNCSEQHPLSFPATGLVSWCYCQSAIAVTFILLTWEKNQCSSVFPMSLFFLFQNFWGYSVPSPSSTNLGKCLPVVRPHWHSQESKQSSAEPFQLYAKRRGKGWKKYVLSDKTKQDRNLLILHVNEPQDAQTIVSHRETSVCWR